MSAISYEALLESLFDGVYYVDKDRRITYWNAAAERITGYLKTEVVGTCCADNILQHIDAKGLIAWCHAGQAWRFFRIHYSAG